MISIEVFMKKYIKEINEDNAAIFAGAGLSSASGYVNWKELLREIASELELDIDKENDLIAIAQYHVNEARSRDTINQRIIELFTKDAKISEIHNILARLPIKIYWTTNYDTLIEDALKNSNKKVDKKIDQRTLATNVPRRDAIVYKMHGDILIPSDAVITKDDYETYNEKRQLFTTALQGDLVSKTFLFVGFSFEDPNLSYVLSRIRILIGENSRTHYAFFKKPNKRDFSSDEDYSYAVIKQKHRIEDLKRYSIQAVMINEYQEILDILVGIEKKINQRNVFISGSAKEYGDWTNESAISLINRLTQKLIINDFKVVTGFGLGIGSYIINTAVQTVNESKYDHFDDYIRINPFPFQLEGNEREEFNTKYRNRMLKLCGIAIFIFGNKEVNGKISNADGVIEEYKIARDNGLIVIPIGSTGFAAKEISDEIKKGIEEFPYLRDKIDTLSTSKDIDSIIESILEIIKKAIGG